ncbi:MAG: hypothetical protein JOZ18_14500 [Chloroflexi bacterium]|nr:hypothetical protein [Chloroflexota bacterium]
MNKYKKLFLSTSFIALLTVLLVACGTIGNGGQATGGDSAAPTPTAPPVTKPADTPLISIRMIDQRNGWALTGNAILKTVDGGLHWQTVKTLPAVSLTSAAAFRDKNYAWVTFHEARAAQGVFTMLLTTNGGASWQTVTIQDPTGVSMYDGIDRPHFITTQEGWVTTGQAEGMHHSSMAIFHTTDGGLHWTMIANTSPQSQSGLPDGGNKTGISFKDSQAGWVTAEIPAIYAWLYMTSDGGKTWQQQTLPIPKEFSNAELVGDFTTTPPVFFGNDGILPTMMFYRSQSYMVLYVTHDGGKTWTSTTPTPIDGDGSNIYVADMQHAWFSDRTTFYATSDGGKSWAKLGQTPSEIGAMSFVDANNGWGIGLPGNKSPLLLHTTDGGRMWQSITYYIQ